METTTSTTATTVMTTDEFLSNWQGHRKLTRRVIEAFPDDKLFTYSVGGMRTFAELAMEIIGMCDPGMDGVVSGNWGSFDDIQKNPPKNKEELLAAWDHVTEKINGSWTKIRPERFKEVESAFGQYENSIFGTLTYFYDNEIHHRGQGYVYLRTLGIEPPPFWDR